MRRGQRTFRLDNKEQRHIYLLRTLLAFDANIDARLTVAFVWLLHQSVASPDKPAMKYIYSLLLLRSPSQVLIVKYCNQRTAFVCLSVCLSACLSVCSHISKTTRPIFTQFSIHVTCGRGSVLLWRQCDMLCTSCIMDDGYDKLQ